MTRKCEERQGFRIIMSVTLTRAIFALLFSIQKGSMSVNSATCADEKLCKDIHGAKPPNPNIVTSITQHEYKVLYQCTEDTIEYTAKLECIDSTYRINGTTDKLTCKNRIWTPAIPKNCIPKEPTTVKPEHQVSKKSQTWKYITGGAAGGVSVMIIIIIIIVILKRKSRKGPSDSKELLPQNMRGSGNFGDNIGMYRIWTVQRSRKKAIVVNNLAQLQEKAGNEFGYHNVRFVLEEDGTCIENDESLQACADRVLLALDREQQWIPAANIQDDKHITRLTFDVCSHGRNMRKLVMTANLKDMKNQCSLSFKYPVESVCLEEDGTMIEDDDALMAMSTKCLMALGRDHVWSEADPGYNMSNISLRNSYGSDKEGGQGFFGSNKKCMYKVWSEDHSQKKIVLAGDLVDLHLKCTKVLGLESPIKIFTRETNEEITEDKILFQMKDKVLIVVKPTASHASEPMYYLTATDKWNGDSYSNGSMGYTENSYHHLPPRRTPDSTASHLQGHERPIERNGETGYPGAVNRSNAYSKVTPYALRHQQSQQSDHRHSNDLSLPYSDLQPHHRESMKLRGSTDEIRSEPTYDNRQASGKARNNRKDSNFSNGTEMFELRDRPYVVSGDAQQSRHCDVLF